MTGTLVLSSPATVAVMIPTNVAEEIADDMPILRKTLWTPDSEGDPAVSNSRGRRMDQTLR